MIRIVIAEDDPGLCELFRERLSSVPDFEVIGEARNGREAIAIVGRLDPDILTLDIDLPGIGGLEVLPVIRWCSPKTKVIVLSSHDEEAIILEALELGAMGYIVKSDGTNLEKAIRAVQRGEVWARRRVLARVLDHLVGLAGRTFRKAGGEPAPA
jgi:DNA-binding NarL/FixJ family response regulator